MQKWILAVAMVIACGTASAGNDSCNNRCGDDTGGATATGGNATGGNGYGGAGGSGTGVGVGVGVGLGGEGGQGGAGGRGGDGGNAVALGGTGGSVNGSGNSHNLNKNDATAISGSVSGAQQAQSARSDQSQSSTNTQSTDASSRNDNKSTASGNNTSVGGQSVTINEAEQPDDITIRAAPSMVVSAPYATVSCYKTFGGSVSGILGAIGASGGRIDQSCEHRELVRVAASVDPEGAKAVLCLNQMFQIANPKQCAGVRPVILLDKKAARQYRANQSAK